MALPPRTIAFIDASNLFYGGEKSLGWKIDYQRLASYFTHRYKCRQIFYFGGIEIHGFTYDYQHDESVDPSALEAYLENLSKECEQDSEESATIMKHAAQAGFYRKLQEFGYTVLLKPVKSYGTGETQLKKANCDVDLTLYLMKEAGEYDRALVLSGDGDFLPVLKHIRDGLGKAVLILARSKRTAREIKAFAGASFRDFETLQGRIEYKEGNKKAGGHPAISSPSLVQEKYRKPRNKSR